MAIVNLIKRITNNKEKYHEYVKSSDSLIYVKEEYQLDSSGADCLALSVGECWYDNGRYIKIGEKGVKVRRRSTVVIVTQESIALPLNIYGLIFGSGKNIYSGGFVSNGKIDPGFMGRLKIAYYNGSNKNVYLKSGERIGYVVFLEAERECKSLNIYDSMKDPVIVRLGKWERFKNFLFRNAYIIIPSLISILGIITSIILGGN